MAAKGARVHIYGDWDGTGVKKAQQDVSAFEKQAAGFSGSFGKSMLGVGAALGGAFAIGNIAGNVVSYLKDAATAAMEEETAVRALEVAMGNLGQASKIDQAEEGIARLSKMAAVADDDLRPAFQKLFTATGNVDQAQRLTALSADLVAAGYGSMESNAKALSKASQGQISALTRLGIPLDASIVKSKDFGAALDVLTSKFGGQASAAAGTYAGQMKSVEIAAGEAQETIGFALLDAVQSATDAFGGAGGMVGVIESAAEEIANFIAGLGVATTALADFLAQADDVKLGTDETSVSLLDLGKSALLAVPAIGSMYGAWTQVTGAGEEYRASQERIDASLKGSEALYAGYTASLDGAAAETRQAAMDSEALAEQLQEVKDNFVSLTTALNASQSMDNFRKSLADLDETLKGNSRSFKGMGDAAKENRDTLRGAFSDAASIAQKWAEDNGKSAAEAQAYYDGLARKIVNQFTKDGFSKSDIMAFLGGEGIWTGPAVNRMKAVGTKASVAAYAAGNEIGRDLALGTIAGLAGQSAGVQASAMRLIAQAEAAARAAAESQSPSKLFARVGKDLTAGLVQGVREGGDDVRANLQTTYKEWFTTTRATLKEGLDAAKAEFRDFSASVSGAIMSGIDFGAAAPQFGEDGKLIGSTFMESLQAQATKAQDFAKKVKELVTMNLSREALSQVLAAGVTAGTAIANELISGGATAITETNELVATTQAAADEVGLMAANNFYGAGVQSAQATYNGFKKNFGKGGPAYDAMQNVMNHLAESLNRSSTITVTTVNRLVNEVVGANLPKRAAGGPVAADNAYWVGEKGPEVFIPDASGTIIPNGGMPTASGSYGSSGSSGGNSYSITVQAGVGDPRQIGQQVVEYIRRFEQANGNVFAAA